MKSYSDYLDKFFPGVKVQKISVNAGFSCPNRDGTISSGGCSYCRNDSFSPSYCMQAASVSDQIEEGKNFFRRKYSDMKFIAYFQSYTNTHGRQIDALRKIYMEALDCEDVVGMAIGTRPDTLPDSVIALLAEINSLTPVFLEIGAETAHDTTLEAINRGHTWADVESAVGRAHSAGLHFGLHLIAGLPGENRERIIENVKAACRLPIETLKIHQLQILRQTPLLKDWQDGRLDVRPFSLEDYLDLCVEICKTVPDHIVIERFLSQSPPDMVVAPKWGLKNYQFRNLLEQRLK